MQYTIELSIIIFEAVEANYSPSAPSSHAAVSYLLAHSLEGGFLILDPNTNQQAKSSHDTYPKCGPTNVQCVNNRTIQVPTGYRFRDRDI